jgi:hypothetical protein
MADCNSDLACEIIEKPGVVFLSFILRGCPSLNGLPVKFPN